MNKIVNGVANDYEFPDLDWVHHDSKTFDEEKFMEEVERRYIKNHTTHIKGYTEEYVNKLNQQIDRLTNNWRLLEEWLIDLSKSKTNWQGDTERMYMLKIDYILDKMKEIKDK